MKKQTKLTRDVYFVSNNRFKYEELRALLSTHGVRLHFRKANIREIQQESFDDILLHKTVEAFDLVKDVVLVDHSGLEMKCLGDLPGGLTQMFWDRLGPKLAEIASTMGEVRAAAVTGLGFCDGKRIVTVQGRVTGEVVSPKGTRDFQWDQIFKPSGQATTYASMSIRRKNALSQRALAVQKLLKSIHQGKAA